MPETYSVTNAWLRAAMRSCLFSFSRKIGDTARLKPTISPRMASANRLSCQLYQNITARKMNRNGQSSKSVTAVQARHQHAGGAMLEVRHRQTEQMAEHGLPQHR